MIRIQDLLFVSSLLTISCLANAEGTEKIVGGNLAYAGEFPGYAIPSGSKIFCGAYLINENTLVTAAHCAGAFKGYNVKIGGTLRSGADAVETIPAIQECVHPQFNSTTHQNDIMLIKLQSPSNQPFKEFYTVCHKMQSFMRRSNEDFMDWCSYISWDYRQSSSFLENGQAVQTVGFGATSYKGALSDDLLKVDMNIISYGTCSNTYWNGLYNKVMVCAGGEGKDTCQGDSGGPLLDMNIPSKIVGIVSWGDGCGTKPGVYTRISAFDSWIHENTATADFTNCCTDCQTRLSDTSNCFSSRNSVEVQGKGTITMDQLKLGDYVKSGANKFSRVYSFSHIDNNVEASFLQIHTERLQLPLEVTPEHIVYVSGKPVRASDVQVGDIMDGHNLVTRITKVRRRGVYAPVTYSGDILVSGVLASSYVSLLDQASPRLQNSAAHAMTGVHRMLCKISFSYCQQETYDVNGVSTFIQPIAHLMRTLNEGNCVLQVTGVLLAIPLLLLVFCIEHILQIPTYLMIILVSVFWFVRRGSVSKRIGHLSSPSLPVAC